MNERKLRHTYYLRGLAPALVGIVLMSYSTFSLLRISSFLLCYLWPYFLFTPGAREKFSDLKYRWSFVGMLMRLQFVIEDGLPFEGTRARLGLALGVPFTVCLVMWALTGAGEPLAALGGAALFALIYRYALHDVVSAIPASDPQTDQVDQNVESVNEPHPPAQNHQTDNDSNS